MAIGQDVDGASLNESHLTLNKWGHIAIDEATMASNLPGVFAGGDCATGAATVVEGVGAGRKGAYAIHAYLGGADQPRIARAIATVKPRFFDIGAGAKSMAPLAEMPVMDATARVSAFRSSGHIGVVDNDGAFAEVETGFDEETALTEAGRCLLCRCQAAGTCSLQQPVASVWRRHQGISWQRGRTMNELVRSLGVSETLKPLVSWPFFQLDHEKCIKCMQCVRICNEVQHRAVYTTDAAGYPALVSGTTNFRDTECNNCGQCVGVCPTGALKDLNDKGAQAQAAA